MHLLCSTVLSSLRERFCLQWLRMQRPLLRERHDPALVPGARHAAQVPDLSEHRLRRRHVSSKLLTNSFPSQPLCTDKHRMRHSRVGCHECDANTCSASEPSPPPQLTHFLSILGFSKVVTSPPADNLTWPVWPNFAHNSATLARRMFCLFVESQLNLAHNNSSFFCSTQHVKSLPVTDPAWKRRAFWRSRLVVSS